MIDFLCNTIYHINTLLRQSTVQLILKAGIRAEKFPHFVTLKG